MAVKKARVPAGTALVTQHEVRVQCAETYLSTNPLHDYGIERMIAEVREALGELVQPFALGWLPDVREQFKLAEA